MHAHRVWTCIWVSYSRNIFFLSHPVRRLSFHLIPLNPNTRKPLRLPNSPSSTFQCTILVTCLRLSECTPYLGVINTTCHDCQTIHHGLSGDTVRTESHGAWVSFARVLKLFPSSSDGLKVGTKALCGNPSHPREEAGSPYRRILQTTKSKLAVNS